MGVFVCFFGACCALALGLELLDRFAFFSLSSLTECSNAVSSNDFAPFAFSVLTQFSTCLRCFGFKLRSPHKLSVQFFTSLATLHLSMPSAKMISVTGSFLMLKGRPRVWTDAASPPPTTVASASNESAEPSSSFEWSEDTVEPESFEGMAMALVSSTEGATVLQDGSSTRDSKGRKLLRDDICNGLITENLPVHTVCRRRPEFAHEANKTEARRLFEGRLEAAFACVKKKREHAAAELTLCEEDWLVCPKEATMFSGEPRWEGSAAQHLLKQDVAEGKHSTMTRTQFCLSRDEHKEFFKAAVDGHVHQEVHTEKFMRQCRARCGHGDGADGEDAESEDDSSDSDCPH